MKCQHPGGCDSEDTIQCSTCQRYFCFYRGHFLQHPCVKPPRQEQEDEDSGEDDSYQDDEEQFNDAIRKSAAVERQPVRAPLLSLCPPPEERGRETRGEKRVRRWEEVETADLAEELPVNLVIYYFPVLTPGSFAVEDLDLPAPLLCRVAHPLLLNWQLQIIGKAIVLQGDEFDEPTISYPARQRLSVGECNELSLLAADHALNCLVEINVGYLVFYRRLLAWMFRSNDDLHTLAQPGTVGPSITETFNLTPGQRPAPAFSGTSTTFRRCPGQINRVSILSHPRRIEVEITLLPPLEFAWEIACVCAAADCTVRHQFVPRAISSPCKLIWDRNCQIVIQHMVPIARGTRIFNSIIDTCLALFRSDMQPAAFVAAVREEIRKWLITANDWEQPCEDQFGEAYKWSIAKALGWIFRNLKDRTSDELDVSLMTFLREMSDVLDTKYCVSLALQTGIGHCQEFATVTFVVLAKLMSINPEIGAFCNYLIHAGEIEVDHAFVTIGFRPCGTDVFKGEIIWELGASLRDSRGFGFICDPYLHPSLVPVAAAEFFQQRIEAEDDDGGEGDDGDEDEEEEQQRSFNLIDHFGKGRDFDSLQ